MSKFGQTHELFRSRNEMLRQWIGYHGKDEKEREEGATILPERQGRKASETGMKQKEW